jgi:hypothetical protein
MLFHHDAQNGAIQPSGHRRIGYQRRYRPATSNSGLAVADTSFANGHWARPMARPSGPLRVHRTLTRRRSGTWPSISVAAELSPTEIVDAAVVVRGLVTTASSV